MNYLTSATKKGKQMKRIIKLLLLFLVMLGSSLYAQTDQEAITSGDNKIEWAYFFKKDSSDKARWFISSTVSKSDTTSLFSLMPIEDGKPGWATVAKKAVTLDLEGRSVSIADIADNPSFEYYDAGWGKKTTNPKIQDDIELIRNSTVDIRWWFFRASNGYWYIINKNGTVQKFASKDGQYNWQEIDMDESVPEFYVDAGVKGVRFGDGEDNNIPNITLDSVINNASNNQRIEPIVIKNSFKEYYAQFDKDVNIAITLKLTPILHLLNNNYDYYKNIILEIYQDKTNHKLLRLPMLEIIGYHLNDKASLDSLKNVFANENDNSTILGQTAKLLAKKGVDISKEVEKRYPTSDGIVKTYYAKILALFKPNKSRAMIEKDMDREMDGNKKIKLISAFAKTGINDDYVINKLMDMLYNTIPNSNFHPVEKDIISIAITINLAKSNRDDRFKKLVDIASNSTFDEDTRSTALDELYYQLAKNKTIDKSDIKIRLQQLSKDILNSDILRKSTKEYLNDGVIQILDTLKGF
jgi:hypothetical protein